MTRLLLLAAFVAIVVVLRRREPIARAPLYREDDDGVQPTDPYLIPMDFGQQGWERGLPKHLRSWTDA